uniref:GIY-YIG nuclease family protein n=1 Tax=Bacillus phage KoopaTroopa TaxID=3234046 RepID=A0AB39C730_9CAUD
MIIYKVTNVVNGKIYIGQTVQELWARKSGHKSHALTELKDNIFSRAIRKYGWDNFKWEIIDNANNKEELNKKEIHWIGHYKSHGVNGYNETDGGEGTHGYIVKEETKNKISKTRLDRMDEYNYSTLNTDTVKEIKILLMSELYTHEEIANMFSVKKNAIGNIKTKTRWSHIFVEGFDEWSDSNVKKRTKKYELKVEDVIEIKKLLMDGNLSQREIADKFNTGKNTIYYIKALKSWTDVYVEGFEEKFK